jgi:two-component system, LytTR family, response regulator
MKNKPLSTVIIDDEPDCVAVVQMLMKLHCPHIDIVGSTTKRPEGVELIRALKPDIVFLDIEMPVLNGFQVLDEIGTVNFQLIFTTAYDRYAVQAFKYSAIDYLLKPIDPQDLIAAINKAEHKQEVDNRQIELLRHQLYAPNASVGDKIALPYAHGYIIVEVAQIVYCESDGSYTKVFLASGEVHLITRSLGEVEETMESNGSFFRIHRQFFINLKHIKRIVKSDGGSVTMHGNVEVPIARNRREDFVKLFTRL